MTIASFRSFVTFVTHTCVHHSRIIKDGTKKDFNGRRGTPTKHEVKGAITCLMNCAVVRERHCLQAAGPVTVLLDGQCAHQPAQGPAKLFHTSISHQAVGGCVQFPDTRSPEKLGS